MYNPTELMLSILQSEEAQYIIDRISPVYGEARVFLWLLQAIGVGLDHAEYCKDLFDAQSLIATATSLTLEYYEDQYGITPDTTITDDQRRAGIYAAMRFKAPLNPKKMESILAALGKTHVTITENTAKNTFSVQSGGTPYTSSMMEFLDRAKPAHLTYEFNVTDKIEAEQTRYVSFQTTTVPVITVDFGGVE